MKGKPLKPQSVPHSPLPPLVPAATKPVVIVAELTEWQYQHLIKAFSESNNTDFKQ